MPEPLKDTSISLFERYMQASRQTAGQEAVKTPWGLKPEEETRVREAIAKIPTPPPQPPKRGLLQKIFNPVGFYITQVVPGFTEWAMNRPDIKQVVRWFMGGEEFEKYQAERGAVAARLAEVRQREGLWGSLDNFFREYATLRKERPKLFWGEKVWGEIIGDFTTYMGWGLGVKLAQATPLLKSLAFVLDTIPSKTAEYGLLWPAKKVRAGIGERLPIPKFLNPFARSKKAEVLQIRQRVVEATANMFGRVGPEEAATIAAKPSGVSVELKPVAVGKPEFSGTISSEGKPIGWFAGRTTEESLRIAALNIPTKEGGRGRQFIADLLTSVEGEARIRGLKFVEAVDPSNVPVYESVGFKSVGEGVWRKEVAALAAGGAASAIMRGDKAATKQVIDTLTAKIHLGAELADDEADVALGLAKAMRVSALEKLPSEEIAEEAFRVGMGVPKTGNPLIDLADLTPKEFIQKMADYSDKMVNLMQTAEWEQWLKGHTIVAQTLARTADSPTATRFMNWFQRYAVAEPARAQLVFLNYGPFNVMEDAGIVVAMGYKPSFASIPNLLESALGVHPMPDMLRGEFRQFEKWYNLKPEAVPVYLRPLGKVGQWMTGWNNLGQRVAANIRRNAFLDIFEAGLVDRLVNLPAEDREILQGIVAYLHEGAHVLKGVDKPMGRTAWMLALQGQFGGVAELPLLATKEGLDGPVVRGLLMKEAHGLHPAVLDNLQKEIVEKGAGVFADPTFRQRHTDFLLDTLMVEPDLVAARFEAVMAPLREMIENAPTADATELRAFAVQAQTMISVWLANMQTHFNLYSPLANAARTAERRGAKFGEWDAKKVAAAGHAVKQIAELHRLANILKGRLTTLQQNAPPQSLEGLRSLVDDLNKYLGKQSTNFEIFGKVMPEIRREYFPGDKGYSVWHSIAEEFIAGDTHNIDKLPVTWQKVLQRAERGVVDVREGNFRAPSLLMPKDGKDTYMTLADALAVVKETPSLRGELKNQLSRTFWDAYRETEFTVTKRGYARALTDSKQFADNLSGHAREEAGWRTAVGAENSDLLKGLEAQIDRAKEPLIPRAELAASELGLHHIEALEAAINAAEGWARRKAASPDAQRSLAAWLHGTEGELQKLSPEARMQLVDNGKQAYDAAVTKMKDWFVNYSDPMVMDTAMPMVFPFWQYQSRAIPRIAGLMVSHPAIAAAMLPNGRFWQMTDEGYLPTTVAGLQVMPLRGTLLSRLRRAWRGEYPPRFSGAMGVVEEMTQRAQKLGFFPGAVWQVGLSATTGVFGGGATLQEVASTFVEELPPAYSTIADGMIAAAAVLPSGYTLKVAEDFFPSKFRTYYMVKALWDRYGVDPATAQEMGKTDWIAQAYEEVALKGIIEDMVSLTRFNPEGWQKLQERVDAKAAEETGMSVEDYQKLRIEAQKAGKRISEVVPLSRIQKAKVGELEGIEALAVAARTMSPEARRRYLDVRTDFYQMLEDSRGHLNAEQKLDDERFLASPPQISAFEWLKNMRERRATYRSLREEALQSRYFGQLGRTPEEQQALREIHGLSGGDHPVDVVLDGLFNMQPPIDPITDEEDWFSLFKAQDEMLKALPADTRKEIEDYLRRNETPLVQEFREKSRKAMAYWRVESGVVESYRRWGQADYAESLADAFRRRREAKLEKEGLVRQGEAVPGSLVAELRMLNRWLDRERDVYREALLTDPSTPDYWVGTPDFLRKFYAKQL